MKPVLVHTPGVDCWCAPELVPIGVVHHCTLNEVHEITDDGGAS